MRNGAACTEAVDFSCAEPKFLENLFVVFSDFLGALCGDLGDVVNLYEAADRGLQVPSGAHDG